MKKIVAIFVLTLFISGCSNSVTPERVIELEKENADLIAQIKDYERDGANSVESNDHNNNSDKIINASLNNAVIEDEVESYSALVDSNNVVCSKYSTFYQAFLAKDDYEGVGRGGALTEEKKKSKIISIFYSPIWNSCLAHYEKYNYAKGDNPFSGAFEQIETSEYVRDMFNGELVALATIESNMRDNLEYGIANLNEKLNDAKTVSSNIDQPIFVQKSEQFDKEIKEIQSEEARLKEDIFSKNLECLNKKTALESKFNGTSSVFGEVSIEQVFYSPDYNNCLYVRYEQSEYSVWRRLFEFGNDGRAVNPIKACREYTSAFYSACYNDEVFVGCDDEPSLECERFDVEISELKK